MSHDFSNLEEEYTPRYCQQLETAYGKGMMSEGGVEGVELMFEDVELDCKKALDIGSGLGGVAFYLSEKYKMEITGLEVNKWMIAEAERRRPSFLKNRMHFVLSTNNDSWPLPQGSFDLIYSKGVLTHIEHKNEMFRECHRLLKQEGLFVVTDWLSSDTKRWGKNIEKLMEMGNLVLYPESEAGYVTIFEKNVFTVLSARDDSDVYVRFNQIVIEKLESLKQSGKYPDCFTKEELEAHIDAYKLILEALRTNELRVVRFVAKKIKEYQS